MKIICNTCKNEYKELYIDLEKGIASHTVYQHDCKIYESIYHQKKIITIEVIE